MRGLVMVGALATLLTAPAAFQTARADDIRQDRRELHQDYRELRGDQRDLQNLQQREAWQMRTGQYGEAARTRELERRKENEIRRDEHEIRRDQHELRRDEYRAGR